jgi:glycosyltransferase (activator-dependent family)
MRILFATYAERTHFHAMVPLARALEAAGHEVVVASQASMSGVISGAGLTAVAVGRDSNLWRVLQLHAKAWKSARTELFPPFDLLSAPRRERVYPAFRHGYEQVVKWWWRLVNDAMAGELTAFARHWRPRLVMWDAGTFSAAIAASAVGAAHARILCGLDLYGAARREFLTLLERQPPQERDDPLASWLGLCAHRAGVPFAEEMTTGHFTVDQLPPFMRMETGLRRLPMRYVPYNGVAVVPRWLWRRPERPRVCVTLGTMNAERLGGSPISVRQVLDALADLEVEVVATVPQAEREGLGAPPANARIVPHVPLHALMGTAAAVVHHGGWGTMSTAALCGVPQLVLAQQFDAPIRGRLLAGQSAGLCLPLDEVGVERLRECVRRLIEDPVFVAGAAGVREQMRAMPAPAAVAAEVTALAAGFGS